MLSLLVWIFTKLKQKKYVKLIEREPKGSDSFAFYLNFFMLMNHSNTKYWTVSIHCQKHIVCAFVWTVCNNSSLYDSSKNRFWSFIRDLNIREVNIFRSRKKSRAKTLRFFVKNLMPQTIIKNFFVQILQKKQDFLFFI